MADNKKIEKARRFLAEKQYETIKDIRFDINLNDMENICRCALDLLEEFGAQRLIEMYDTLIENAVKFSALSRVESIFMIFKYIHEGNSKSAFTQNQNDLLCYVGLKLITTSKDKKIFTSSYNRTEYNRAGSDVLKYAAECGSAKAKEMLKFGLGKIDKQYLHYKDKNVECSANDITMIINFKLKEETVEAYAAMLKFLIEALEHDFPIGFEIRFNSKLKDYIPVRGLKKSKTNQFFQNCVAYPSLYPLMKQYIRLAMNGDVYYADAEEEEAVNIGGYATFALGMADAESNLDIVEEFFAETDLEHACTSRYFIRAFIKKWNKDKKYEKALETYKEYFE